MQHNTEVTGGEPFERIVVVHGFDAAPTDHWFGWLDEQVPGVERLTLPTPRTPVASEWIGTVTRALGEPTSAVAVVGHSLGCITAARAIGALTSGEVGAFVAVAPFAEHLPASDPDLARFNAEGLGAFLDGYDPAAVRAHAARIHVLRSDDDPAVPPPASDRFARDLGADVTFVPGAGHFCGSDGVTRLPQVLDALGLG